MQSAIDLRYILLLSGDIQSNPGPSQQQQQQHHYHWPCAKCKLNVPFSRKLYSIRCDICSFLVSCTGLSRQELVSITRSRSSWHCGTCQPPQSPSSQPTIAPACSVKSRQSRRCLQRNKAIRQSTDHSAVPKQDAIASVTSRLSAVELNGMTTYNSGTAYHVTYPLRLAPHTDLPLPADLCKIIKQ